MPPVKIFPESCALSERCWGAGNPGGPWLPDFLVLVFTLMHSKSGDVTCVPISPLMIDAYNILVKKKLDKFYVLSIGASTAEVKGVVSAIVHKRSTLGSQKRITKR